MKKVFVSLGGLFFIQQACCMQYTLPLNTLPPIHTRVNIGMVSFRELQQAKTEEAETLANSVDFSKYSETLSVGINDAFLQLLNLITRIPESLLQTGSKPLYIYKKTLGERVLHWLSNSSENKDDALMKSAIVCYYVDPSDVFLARERDSLFKRFIFPSLGMAAPVFKQGIDSRVVTCWMKICDFIGENKSLLDIKNNILDHMYYRGLIADDPSSEDSQ